MITGLFIVLAVAVVVYGWWKLMDRVEGFRQHQADKYYDNEGD